MENDLNWYQRAACLGKPIEWFFPEYRERTPYQNARAICRTCDVLNECLDDAMADTLVKTADRNTDGKRGSGGGFRAGMTASERSRIRRNRNRVA